MENNDRLIIKDLSKTFGNHMAIDNINLNISKNEIIGIVGNNGAGKTTLFKLILDLIKPSKGQVISMGKNVYQSEHWKSYTSAFIDQNFLIDYLTASEYLYLIGQIKNMNRSDITNRLEQLKSFLGNDNLNSKKFIRDLSDGNKQKVGITGTLICNPDIIILDEPYNYIDPASQFLLKQILKEYLNSQKASILLSSHNLQFIVEVCDRIVVMKNGQIIYETENKISTYETLRQYFTFNF